MPHIEEAETEPQENFSQSIERRDRIRVKNRRKMYLDRHPSYFTSPDLELAGGGAEAQHAKSRLTIIRSITL
jgi:hypothetical protein